MHDESTIAGPVRLSRTLILAAILATVGLLRLTSDLLTDVDPGWASWLAGSPFRHFVRISDGSLAGNLLNAGLTGGVQAAARRWADPRLRLAVIAALAALRTFCEIAKATHLLGLPSGLVKGERAWLNHIVHAVGGVIAYGLSRVLRYTATDAATAESIDQNVRPEAPTGRV